MKKLWAIALAVPHEISGILKFLAVRAETRAGPVRLWEGQWGGEEVVLVQTGVGPKRASRAAEILFDRFPVSHLLSSGYCGGLKEGMACGQAVIADSLRGLDDEGSVAGDAELGALASEVLIRQSIVFQRGQLVSSPRAVLKIKDKEALAGRTGAIAVDMESYPLVRAAHAKKIASVTVRFVVDASQDELTDTEPFLDEEAKVQPFRLIREMIRRPKILIELPGLEKKASHARAAMAAFCDGFFGGPVREIS